MLGFAPTIAPTSVCLQKGVDLVSFPMNMLEYLIIGAGPAGIQAGYYLKKSGKKFTILERLPEAGGFFRKYPLHRMLISVNKSHSNYSRGSDVTLRWDWNSLLTDECNSEKLLFSEFSNDYFASADYLTNYCVEYSKRHNLPIIHNQQVVSVSRKDSYFSVETITDHYETKKLIVATGNHRAFIPDIKGIEFTSNYSTIEHNPENYKNKKVLIIGKGNTGMETANMMVGYASTIHMLSPSPIKFAWHSNFPGHVRAVNMTFLDSCLLSRDNLLLNGRIQYIKKQENGKLATLIVDQYKSCEVEYDEIINCTGFSFDSTIFDEACKPELVYENRYPKIKNNFESINIPNLYFAGALTASRDFKVSSSAFIHGFRYNSKALGKFLNLQDSNISWESNELNLDIGGSNKFKNIARTILERAENSSGLWHLLGMMNDVFCFPKKNCTTVKQYLEVPRGLWNEQLCKLLNMNEDDYIFAYLTLDIAPQKTTEETFSKKNIPHARIVFSNGKQLIFEQDTTKNDVNQSLSNEDNVLCLSMFLEQNISENFLCKL